MKLVTLLENTACSQAFRANFGLSLYFETPKHRILFDAGPNGDFAANAEALGVDLSAVDIAVLSHGQTPEGVNYIGLDPRLESYRHRFTVVEGVCRIDDELTLFDAVPGDFPTMDTSHRLKRKNDAGDLIPDTFAHEQDLLITAEGKSVLVAGCSHRGIVNIQRRGAEILGRQPDAVVGGFHLFQLDPAAPALEKLLNQIGHALLPGDTVYYTGHCTGEYPFRVLHGILGDRLRSISAGFGAEL